MFNLKLFGIISALSLSFTVVYGTFWLTGYDQCREMITCYEFSNIFQIYKHIGLVLPVFAPVLFFVCIQILYKIRSESWNILTVIWVPVSLILTMILGSSSNGWIPTGPSSQSIILFLIFIYIITSTYLLYKSKK